MKKVLISFLNLIYLLIIIVCFSLSLGVGWGDAYAQIVIEERVEIKPQNQVLPDNPTQNYNFRVEVDWDAVEVQANNHFWNADLQVNTRLKNSCEQFVGETGFIYGWPTGSNSLEVSANAYSYEIFVTLSGFYNSYQFVDLIVRTYLNSELLNTFTRQVNSGIWPNYSDTVTTSFYQFVYLVEEFNFNVDDDLMEYGCFYTVDLRTNPGGNCSSSLVASLERDSINLSILTGDEYLAFYDNRIEEIVGTNVQVNQQFINEIDLIYQNPLRDSVSRIAVIQLESNGIVETDSVEILPAPDDLNVWVSPEEITTGEQASVNIYIDYCPPFETTINIEIIKGQEYGGLIDPVTTNKTQIITNLEHFFGFAWVDYKADSISSEISDSVVFRVTTSDPEIVPKEALLIIKSPPIHVYTVPEVLGADDTADVFIKHRLENGTLEDFPPEQTFELGVLDGCVNGNFMVGDSISNYFADALQPIKFVTADELEPEFDKVLIRVGTDLGGGGGGGAGRPVVIGNREEEKVVTEKRKGLDTLRAGFEKMIAEKKAEAEAKKKENNEPPIEAPIVAACTIEENMIYQNYWRGFTKTEYECGEGAPKCATQVEAPLGIASEVEYRNTYIKSGFLERDLCKITTGSGFTWIRYDNWISLYEDHHPFLPLPVKDEFYSPYNIFTCFNNFLNNGNGAYQYKLKSINESEDSIYINFIISECDKFPKPISSESQLSSIPTEEICKALQDFELGRYRQAEIGEPIPNIWVKNDVQYSIIDVIYEHEKYHVRDATMYANDRYAKEKLTVRGIDGAYITKTLKQHLENSFNCSELIKSYDDAKNKGEEYIKNALKEFMNFHNKTWYAGTVQINFDGEKVYRIRELFAHWSDRVQNKITKYQSILKSREGFDEKYCDYHLKNWDPFKIYRNDR